MKPGDLEKLLGGYATGSLTPDELAQLHRAALNDQRLFDLLADEQGLKELLSDAATREELLRAITAAEEVTEAKVVPIRPRRAFWTWSLATAAAGLFVLGGVYLFKTRPEPEKQVAFEISMSETYSAAPVSPPAQAEVKPEPKQAAAARRTVPKPAEERQLAAVPAPPPPSEAPQVAYGVSEREQKPQERSDVAAPRKVVASEAVALGKVEADIQASRLAAKDEAALPWSLHRKTAEGAFEPIAAGQTLNVGDEVLIEVRPPVPGTLIAELVEGSERRLLFSQAVEVGKAYPVPGRGSLPSQAGARRILVTLAPQPRGAVVGFRQAGAPAGPALTTEIKLEFR